MQGRADPQREILDVESVAGHLLPEGGVFAFLAGHRHELFPEEGFADLFRPGGRPSVPAEVGDGLGDRVADAARSVGQRDGRGGDVRPDTGIIIDIALAAAAGADNSDAAVGVDLLLSTEQDGQGERWEVLADSAYGTGDALGAIERAGHAPIIKPWPLHPAVEGGFTLDDFLVVESDGDRPGSVTCLNGLTRPISPRRSVTFGAGCRGCPLRALHRRQDRPHVDPAPARRDHPRTANAPRIRGSGPSTAGTGPWSNARSPGSSPAATGGCGSAEPCATISGCITASPGSTCVACSPSGWHAPPARGASQPPPDPPAGPEPRPSPARAQPRPPRAG